MKLFQETWRRRPFWMLVGCVLVNRATWAKAQFFLETIHGHYKTPQRLSRVKPHYLASFLMPLGFQNKRAKALIAMAKVWSTEGGWRKTAAENISDLPGCGKYAADSWAIFVEGRRDVVPTDAKLKRYLLERAC